MGLIQYHRYQDSLNEQSKQPAKPSCRTLNVFDYVSQLRKQRYLAVDSLENYLLIYRACLEYIKFGSDDLNDGNDGYGQPIKLNAVTDYYPNRLSYMVANPNIVEINYHNMITQSAGNGILPEFDV